MKNEAKNSIYLLLTSLMTFSLSLASIQYTDLEYKKVVGILGVLLISFAFSFLWKQVFRSIVSLIISLAITLLLSSLIYVIKFMNMTKDTNVLVNDFLNFIEHFIFHWSVSMEKPLLYQPALIIGIIFIISIVMYLSICKFKKFYIATFLASIIFIAQWAIIHEVQALAFYIYLPTIFLLYVFNIYNKKHLVVSADEKQFFQNSSAFIKGVTPIILISLLIVFVLPRNKAAIQIPWLDQLVKDRGHVTRVMKYDFFSLSNSGFSSNNNKLNSKVNLNDTIVLNAYCEKPLYLKGSSYDVYTGKNWQKSSFDKGISYYNSNNSRLNAISELYHGTNALFIKSYTKTSGKNVFYYNISLLNSLLPNSNNPDNYTLDNRLFHTKSLSLIYKNLVTKTVFTPPYSKFLDKPHSIVVDDDEVFTSNYSLISNQHFLYEYVDIDFTSPNVQFLIKQSKEGFYYEIYSYIETLYQNLTSSNIPNPKIDEKAFLDNYPYASDKLLSLMENAKHNVNKYTAIPYNISNRVKVLSYNLTKDAKSTYDKVKNIEKYFEYDFTYSLNPKPLPDDKEFVDFFLFESKEGYCSSFATAMTIMVRSLGIPARYVEGYVLPSKKTDDNLYEIRNRNAHAWVEVYFEGFGWITFEPTFAFSYTQDEQYEGTSLYDDKLLDNSRYDEYISNLDETTLQDTFDPTISELSYPISSIKKEKQIPFNYKLLLIILLFILLLIYISVRLVRIYNFSHIKNNKVFIKRYNHILASLAYLKYTRLKHQTLNEYALSIDQEIITQSITLTDITNIYYKVIYNNYKITKRDGYKLQLYYKEYIYALQYSIDLFEYILKRHIIPFI